MSKAYRIAVVAACPFPHPRGTPTRILRMAEGLAARGHEVHIVTYHLGKRMDDLPFPIHRIPNIATYRKMSPGPTYQKIAVLDAFLAVKLWQVTGRWRFDIIHAHHYEGLLVGLPVARLRRIPLVFDVHTLLASELPHYPLGLSTRILHSMGDRLDHWLPPRADHVVAVTASIRNQLINGIGLQPANVTTVYGGIEDRHFTPPASPEPDSVSRTLIYTGNLAPYQGIDLMLRALHKVVQHRPDARLKIITNSSIQPYADLIATLGLQDHIQIGESDYFQLPAQLHTAGIALNPRAHSDGLPLKLLNYMATGRAIVSFEGSSEILEHEQTGLVVPGADADSFARAILRLLDDSKLAETLGRNAQAHVREFFVWEEAIQSLEAIYRSLLERRA